jgi:adenylate cyclase
MILAANEKSHIPFRSLIQKYATHQGVNQPLVEEHKLALFFLDIRDFTPFIASRSALEVVHLLQQLFAIFQPAIQTNHGNLIETAGDGLYAVFGLEDTLENATTSALQAGLDILQAVAQANKNFFGPYFKHHFQVGIGLHVGKVIVSRVGLGVNNNLTVLGYPVNIASRLQDATKRLNNSFIISQEAYGLLNKPPMAAYEQIYLKGIQDAMEVHLVGQAYELA